MKNFYKQPIITFGAIAPIGIMLLLIVGLLVTVSKFSNEFKLKKQVYDSAMKEQNSIAELQGKVGQNGVLLKEWNNLMKTETRGSYVAHWKETEAKFPGKELTRSSNNWVNFSEGLGKGNAQPASQVSMTFSATYKAMQLALLEIESKLPQMQLDSMSMTPSDDGERLNFKTTFTVWTQK